MQQQQPRVEESEAEAQAEPIDENQTFLLSFHWKWLPFFRLFSSYSPFSVAAMATERAMPASEMLFSVLPIS